MHLSVFFNANLCLFVYIVDDPGVQERQSLLSKLLDSVKQVIISEFFFKN